MPETSGQNHRAKYRCLLSQERTWAQRVARSIDKPRPISVWEVMIPLLLIFGFVRSKEKKEVMIQNLLFTKEAALKAALEMSLEGLSREEALGPIKEKTRGLLTSVQEGLYSEDIRRNQLKEITLLTEHYGKLIGAEGEEYGDLIRNAYPSLTNYLAFLDQLRQAEKEVNTAALNTLGTRGNPGLVTGMEEALDGLRRRSALKIFNVVNGLNDAGRRRTSPVV